MKLGLKLGKQGLYDYFSAFGLTETTGVDYPGEARGWLPKPSAVVGKLHRQHPVRSGRLGDAAAAVQGGRGASQTRARW